MDLNYRHIVGKGLLTLKVVLYLLISIQDKLTEDLGGVGAGSPGQCPLDNVSDTRSSGQPEEAPLSAGARSSGPQPEQAEVGLIM